MNLKGEMKRKKFFLAILMICFTAYLYANKYIDYSNTLEGWDKKENIYQSKYNEILESVEQVKKNITNLEKEQQEILKTGVNINNAKASTNKLIQAINTKIDGVSLRLTDMKYYKNYNNLLKVKMKISRDPDRLKNIKNLFIAKKLLNLSKVKKALKVYGEYNIVGNDITYYYYQAKR